MKAFLGILGIYLLVFSANVFAQERIVTGKGETHDGRPAACKSAKDDASSKKQYNENVVGFSQCDCSQATTGDHRGLWTCAVDAKLEKKR